MRAFALLSVVISIIIFTAAVFTSADEGLSKPSGKQQQAPLREEESGEPEDEDSPQVTLQRLTPLPPRVEKYLHSGELKKGEKELLAHLKKHPHDDEARFGLGLLQFMQSVEGLLQSLHRHGFMSSMAAFYRGAERMPERQPGENSEPASPFDSWPEFSKDPQSIHYHQMRQILVRYVAGLSKAEQTLAAIKDKNVKLRLRLKKIRLDIDGNGKATELESFFGLSQAIPGLNGNQEEQKIIEPGQKEEAVEEFAITFDYADVQWWRGYMHVFMGINEFALSLNWKDTFDRTAHLAFPKVESPYSFLRMDVASIYEKYVQSVKQFENIEKKDPKAAKEKMIAEADEVNFELEMAKQTYAYYADLIAFLQLMNYKVTEPKRLEKSLYHAEQVIKLSRLTWEAIEAETDDIEEWIPNPKQTGVLEIKVTPEIIAGWKEFLDEMEAILAGKKLVPHWRVNDGRAINVRKFFAKSKQFAPVLLIQGSDIAPFLEKGENTQLKFWTELMQKFGEGGSFFGFAIWFN